MSKQQDNRRYFHIKILRQKVKYRGDINEIVYKEFENGKQNGLILHSELDNDIKTKLLRFLLKIPYINWFYISEGRNEVMIFSLNVNGFNKNIDIERLRKDISRILEFEINEISVYPVKNVLCMMKPLFPKDRKIGKDKTDWYFGKLGKKKFRKKYTNMVRKIIYSRR